MKTEIKFRSDFVFICRKWYSKIKVGSIEGALEVKKKINTDIKAAIMLIIAEDIIALRSIIGTVIKSISKSVGVNGESILPGSKKKTKFCNRRKML